MLNQERRILVTDAERGSALSIIRSLGRRGRRVFPASAQAGSPAFRSRFASEPVLHPSPRSDPHGFVRAISEAVRRHAIDLVIPVSDDSILPLLAVREQLERECRLALPTSAALEVARDKLATFELAEKVGVETPRTRLVRSVAEALREQPALGWPVVLKPRWSRVLDASGIESFEVSYAENKRDLAARMGDLEGRCDVLLQEYYPGTGCGIELLLDRGRPVAAFQHVRIRELPVTGGASCLRTSAPLEPELLRRATALLGELEWTGLAMVELKVGAAGPRLIEINGRVWGSLPLAVRAGVDFPALLGDLCLDGLAADDATSVGVEDSYEIGMRGRDLGLDLLWIGSVLLQRRRYPSLPFPSRLRGLMALFSLLDPRIRSDVMSLADPMPGLLDLAMIARKLRAKLAEPAA